MARIMAIDYGAKRTGLAVTDPLQIVVSGLDTVPTDRLLDFLKSYFQTETVETIVIGESLHRDGTPTDTARKVYELVEELKKLFPGKSVLLQDERYTSREASRILIQSGIKKKKRREKALVDKVSAVLILEDYMYQKIWKQDF